MPSAAKLDAWSKYVTVVVEALGQWCSAYQLLNEPNSPVYQFFNSQQSAIAVTRAASAIRAHFSQAYIAVNISMEIWGWRKYLERLLRDSGTAIDIVGLDHYPGTWAILGHRGWWGVVELSQAAATAKPGSLWHGRHICIMETGYSTNAPTRGQGQQKAFYAGLNQVTRLLKQMSVPSLPVLGIYELCDFDSSWQNAAFKDPQVSPRDSNPIQRHIVISISGYNGAAKPYRRKVGSTNAMTGTECAQLHGILLGQPFTVQELAAADYTYVSFGNSNNFAISYFGHGSLIFMQEEALESKKRRESMRCMARNLSHFSQLELSLPIVLRNPASGPPLKTLQGTLKNCLKSLGDNYTNEFCSAWFKKHSLLQQL